MLSPRRAKERLRIESGHLLQFRTTKSMASTINLTNSRSNSHQLSRSYVSSFMMGETNRSKYRTISDISNAHSDF